jgi:hypothetical protein
VDATNIISSILVIALGVFFAFFPGELAVLHRKFNEFLLNPKGDLAGSRDAELRTKARSSSSGSSASS